MRRIESTRGLFLTTRYRERQFEGDACLLVYDEEILEDAVISNDVKAVFEQRATTANIYIVAPFVSPQDARKAFSSGASVQRASAYLAGHSGQIFLFELAVKGERAELNAIPMTWPASGGDTVEFGTAEPISPALREGWLFDLFDRNEGLVVAPEGVHFRKGSKKHTNKFLRTANALTASACCALLALFSLAEIQCARPRRILVDTSPLISVAFAMLRIAVSAGMWSQYVPVRSFGSYGGLDQIGRLSTNDVCLISASTSGSLAGELKHCGAKESGLVTLYYLGAEGGQQCPPKVLCDMTAGPGRLFGYQRVENFTAKNCRLCHSNFLLAELEGDQFLLQKRQHRLIKVSSASQSTGARETVELLARREVFAVAIRPDLQQTSSMDIAPETLISCPSIEKRLVQALRRFCPSPLALIVRVGISERTARRLAELAGLDPQFASAKDTDWTNLSSVAALPAGSGVLALFAALDNHSTARELNARLRGIAPGGAVTYLAGLTLAESAERYGDLKMFLQYGEDGPDTFTFRDVARLAIPSRMAATTSWEDEIVILNEIAAGPTVPDEIRRRREFLSTNSSASSQLFWPSSAGELTIQSDFVYLDTAQDKERISQADIFAVVSNLLCTAREGNVSIDAKLSERIGAVRLTQTVYGQVLLDPANFLTYNDPVLKAAFLRAALPAELLYEVEESSSETVAGVILGEIAAWKVGEGGALPEFVVSLATRRMRLGERHLAAVKGALSEANLPPYLRLLADRIPSP